MEEIGKKDILVPYLLDRRIKNIDYIIVSHFDSDHCEGLIEVIEELKVKNIIISKQSENSVEYRNFIAIANKKNIKIRVVKRGDKIVVDKCINIEILAPEEMLKHKDLNNNSIVAKLNYNNFSMLFTGDIESPAEKNIVGVAWYATRAAYHAAPTGNNIKNTTPSDLPHLQQKNFWKERNQQ